jgi:Domain of unknown function (DUF4340)
MDLDPAPEMNRRTVFWLGVCACGLALWWLMARNAGPISPHEIEISAADRLLAWPLERLSTLEFGQPLNRQRIVRLPPKEWRYQHKASNQETMDFIAPRLRMFSAARIERSFTAPPSAFTEYGITGQSAEFNIYIDDASVPVRSLRVGNRTPDGFGQYVLLEEEQRIVTVPAYHIENLAALAAGAAK